jgi:hypothetical protein
MRYKLLEGEPEYPGPSGRCQPLWLSPTLAVARLALHAFLTLVRLTVSTVIALAIAVALFAIGMHVAGGRTPLIGDASDYLSGVLDVSADWMRSEPKLNVPPGGYISETSSTSVTHATPAPGSAASLVETLSRLAPSELQRVYQQAVPTLQEYDAFLGGVQSALANDRDLDAFFSDVQPWLQQAEDESQRTAATGETPTP